MALASNESTTTNPESQIHHESDGNGQRLKERQETEKQVQMLRQGIQTLCRNTHPLSKTMDYIQEDLDSMGREFSVWRQEVNQNLVVFDRERRETLRELEPLQAQVHKLQNSVKHLHDQLREKKTVILQNESSIQKLVLSMVSAK